MNEATSPAAASLETVLRRLDTGARHITLGGLTGSSKAYLLSRLIREGRGRTYVFIGPRGKEAVRFQQDLDFFLAPFGESASGGEVFFFPPQDVLPFSHLSPHNQITCDRLRTLHALTRPTKPSLIATTITATLSPLPPKSLFENPLEIRLGQEIDREAFVKRLTEWGYQNVPLVIDRGNFAVRGSLLDVFPPHRAHPLRIEWMGDLIETIREFDAKTQRSLEGRPFLKSTSLIPAREVIFTEETIRRFTEKARRAAEDADLPRSAWAEPAEKVKAGIPFPGVETYLPLFYPKASSFWDWLPEDAVIVTDDADPSLSLASVIQEHGIDVGTLVQGKASLLKPADILQSAKDSEQRMAEFPRLSFTWMSSPEVLNFPTETHTDLRRDIEKSKKGVEPLAPLARRLQEWLSTDRVVLVAGSRPQAERLHDLLTHYRTDLPAVSDQGFSEIPEERPKLTFLIGELSEGFRLASDHVTVLTDQEIFGQKVRRSFKGSFSGESLSSFAEIKPGEPLVHKEHGIGLYRGVIPMEVIGETGGTRNDFLVLEFRDGDKLYLPVYRMNLVHRYTGPPSEGGKEPRLDKMGGASWGKVTAKASKAIRELAGDLLNLYAARASGLGFAFTPPNDLFETFEASFPYEETPDQERAIAEVLQDLQKNTPMDRLVLGDVGYGKTEVALRAAFKAVLDGKQVAFLVPTTLLAFQHYERFLQRFQDYPVKVDMLSRFRSAAEQKKVLEEAREGRLDIIVGTHRLLQADVSFKDLGLLIVDEEHRFGVEQKERMKRLKKDVHVLALSATPIPRTLYMSLVGIRSISVIETPPTDRLSIRTYVMPFEEGVIQEAIQREIRRGGQVFFVHNEIESIGAMKEHLQRIAPEAKIEIGHGQMDEEALEKVMIRFSHQEFNLLLCTTIIESGIDIPTANTILINDADHFGLAQIYQLRGRVGRGGHRAYAYLLVPGGEAPTALPAEGALQAPSKEAKLTSEASQRLAVLQRFSDLGSGYKMASYDLEIRGAGNLLGAHQSGHMTAIGYELYTELFTKAVEDLKRQRRVEGEAPAALPMEGATRAPFIDEIDPELHFRLPAYLPDDYVPDPPVRLELYRRLSSLDSEDEADPIEEEMRDRFGRPPPETENLLELSALKALAKKLRIKQIRYDGKHFVYAFDSSRFAPAKPDAQLKSGGESRFSTPIPPIGTDDGLLDALLEKIKTSPKRYRLTPDHRFIVSQSLEKETLALQAAKKFLRELTLHLEST